MRSLRLKVRLIQLPCFSNLTELLEQKMIESLGDHGVLCWRPLASINDHPVANPVYDPEQAHRKNIHMNPDSVDDEDDNSIADQTRLSTSTYPSEPSCSLRNDPLVAPVASIEAAPTNSALQPNCSTIKQVPTPTKDASAAPCLAHRLLSLQLTKMLHSTFAGPSYATSSSFLSQTVSMMRDLAFCSNKCTTWIGLARCGQVRKQDHRNIENKDLVEATRKATTGGGLVVSLAPVIRLGLVR